MKIFVDGIARDAEFDEKKAIITIEENEDGENEAIEVAWKWAICSRCNGHGKHVHEALSVWTEEDRDEDPDGFDDMRAGRYDVTCETCEGSGKVRVIDEDKTTKQLIARLYDLAQDEREYQQMCAMERRMGA